MGGYLRQEDDRFRVQRDEQRGAEGAFPLLHQSAGACRLLCGGMGAKGKGRRINVICLIVRWYCSSFLSLALGEKAIKGG